MNAAQIHQVLRAAGWPEDKIVLMGAIALAESSGNPSAVNRRGEYSVGLLQVNISPHLRRPWTEAQLKDPLFNARVALQIYREQGLRAWGAYTDGNYRRFLSQSQAAYTGSSLPPPPSGSWQQPQWAAITLPYTDDPFALPFTSDSFVGGNGPAQQGMFGGAVAIVGIVGAAVVVGLLLSE